MSLSAAEISEKLEGELIGQSDRKVVGLSPIQNLENNTVTFLGNPKYRGYLESDVSRTILISQSEKVLPDSNNTFIRVDNVYAAFSDLSHWWDELKNESLSKYQSNLISNKSQVHNTALIGKNASVGEFTIIGKSTSIGDHVQIDQQVYIGNHVKVGEGTHIMPGVKIMDNVQVGKHCLIYPNAVIGTDGFGHVLINKGHQKINHIGGVIIEDHVEIGSNTVIDRGVVGNTIIRKGVKLDNLIQVAHGVEIGEGTVIAAQTGISGSAKIGPRSMIGGQVGIVGHVKIAEGSKIQAKSGIASDIETPNRKWYGYPVLSYLSYLRSYSLFKRLPELFDRLKSLEDKD